MKKTTVRVLSIILVALMVLGLFSSALVMLVHAAPATGGTTATDAKIITGDTTVSRTMTVGKVATGLTIKFNFQDPSILFNSSPYLSDEIEMPSSSSFGWSYNTTLTITRETKRISGRDVEYYSATFKNVSYRGKDKGSLKFTLPNEDIEFDVDIPPKYFNETGGEDGAPESAPIWQSTTVLNATGQKLESVDKKTGPFTVEVIFYDTGLKDESNSSIDAAKKYAFITPTADFKLHNGSSGTLERISSTTGFPRFKATFKGVEYTGTKGASFNFSVLYDFEEYEKSIKGDAIPASLSQIKTEDEDDEAATLKPKIMISEYSYGKEAIVAGEEFDLNLSFYNTSSTVAVENVDMKIVPSNGFTIMAASGAAYFQSIAPNETKNFSIALKANPAGDSTISAPTDYSVEIKFEYQYLSQKTYSDGASGEPIAIRVTQLDRFGVDEITDYSQYMNVGEEGYVTVPITNKGKSTTYNITCQITTVADVDFVAAPVHFGNLEAGKSDSIDVSLTVNTPGEFEAMAVVTYEDENMNQKKIAVPFSIMVIEPQPPQMEMPPMNPEGDISQQGPGLITVIFCAVGAIMMAVPVALYLIKRVKAKGSEDIDEDF